MYKFVFILLLFTGASHAGPLVLSPDEKQNLGLEVAAPIPVAVIQSQQFPAKVVIPNSGQTTIHSTLDGVVMNLFKAEGDVVSQGETLAIVNSPQLISLQSDFLQSLTTLRQAELDWQREKQLFDEGIIAERRYTESQTRINQTRNLTKALQKQLRLSGLSDSDIRTLTQRGEFDGTLTITAQSDGVVMRQDAVVGQRLTALDKIYEIADLSTLWLEVHVPLEIARMIHPGNKALVVQPDVSAEVMTIGRKVHEIDQGVMVRAKVTNNTALLTPGETVEVSFLSDSQETRYRIPETAIIRLSNAPYIFVETNAGIVAVAVIIISQETNGVVIQLDEAQELNQVIVAGLAALKAAWQNQEAP